MKILDKPITLEELKKVSSSALSGLIKAVVDVDKKIIVIDADLHSDLEALLLAKGSKQKDLWGINFYPDLESNEFLEFDSMINIRPSYGNMSRGVEDEEMRNMIKKIVNNIIKR